MCALVAQPLTRASKARSKEQRQLFAENERAALEDPVLGNEDPIKIPNLAAVNSRPVGLRASVKNGLSPEKVVNVPEKLAKDITPNC